MQLFICVHENLSVLRSATELKTFTDYPSEELLEKCTKEQLLTFVEHYSVPVTDKHLKELIKVSLKLKLLEMGLIKAGQEGFSSVFNPIPEEVLHFSFLD